MVTVREGKQDDVDDVKRNEDEAEDELDGQTVRDAPHAPDDICNLHYLDHNFGVPYWKGFGPS